MKTNTKARLRRFAGCRVFWVTIACILIYVALASTLPTQPFLEFVRILQATTAIIVAVAFSADAWDALTADENEADPTDSLVIAAFIQHLALFFTGFWLLLYRLADRPSWMLDVLAFGFVSGWLSSLASILTVWAPGVLRSGGRAAEIPPARLRMVGVAAAVGVFATLVVLATQPNAQWIVDNLRPWVP